MPDFSSLDPTNPQERPLAMAVLLTKARAVADRLALQALPSDTIAQHLELGRLLRKLESYLVLDLTQAQRRTQLEYARTVQDALMFGDTQH